MTEPHETIKVLTKAEYNEVLRQWEQRREEEELAKYPKIENIRFERSDAGPTLQDIRDAKTPFWQGVKLLFWLSQTWQIWFIIFTKLGSIGVIFGIGFWWLFSKCIPRIENGLFWWRFDRAAKRAGLVWTDAPKDKK